MVANVAQSAMAYSAFATFNGEGPAGGPRAISAPLTFSAQTTQILVDFTVAHMQDKIEGVQGIYVDNSLNSNPLIITSPQLNQNLTWPAYSQGFLPVLSVSPPQFTVSSGGYIGTINVIFTSFAVPAEIWVIPSATITSGSQTVGTSGQNGAFAISAAQSNTTGPAQPARYTTAASTNLVLVRANAINMYGGYAYNTDTVPYYIHLFNAVSTGNVTLGTTTPQIVIPMPPGVMTPFDDIFTIYGNRFGTGCVMAVTANFADLDATALSTANKGFIAFSFVG